MAEFEAFNAGNSEAQEKEAAAYLWASSITNGIAATGVIGGLDTVQTATASGSVEVIRGAAVVQATLLNGVSVLVCDSTKTLDIFTANPMGALPRNDIVVFDSVTTSLAAIIGTPNATPTDPTVPNTALALSRLRHAASATTIPTAKIDPLIVYTTLRGVNPKAPFAQAAGLVTGFSAGTLNPNSSIFSAVTFPSGRFTVAPLVTATMATAPSGTGYLTCRVLDSTASGCNVYVHNTGSAAVTFSGLSVTWSAVQMTSTTAAG